MNINITQLARTSAGVRGTCPGVYFLFQDRELVYIGHGQNCFLEVAHHTGKETAGIFNRWSFVRVDDASERMSLAHSLIAEHRPPHNREQEPGSVS
ncbi:hypothetical protein [Noviherbaspirillum malthae]|jgi:hypothetical protein|uniref:hypothetical protein n=1 Tax=Noviherbaspirillum malthae TaxID=1260987 RepID=UPI001890A9B2|nr:hypothetical protein [Noviherbaspirillum malthae]